MNSALPSIEDVRIRLQGLKHGEISAVAKQSGVPSSTLWKIRIGATPNPGLETVRKFFHLLPASTDTSTQAEARQGVA